MCKKGDVIAVKCLQTQAHDGTGRGMLTGRSVWLLARVTRASRDGQVRGSSLLDPCTEYPTQAAAQEAAEQLAAVKRTAATETAQSAGVMVGYWTDNLGNHEAAPERLAFWQAVLAECQSR